MADFSAIKTESGTDDEMCSSEREETEHDERMDEDSDVESGGPVHQQSPRHAASFNFLEASDGQQDIDGLRGMGFGGDRTGVRRLLGQGSRVQFVIPPFQRPYVWSEGHALSLAQGMLDYFNKNQKFYYIGNIFFWYNLPRDEARNPKVLDGQQRLTTLTLILGLIRIFLCKSPASSKTNECLSDLKNCLFADPISTNESRLVPKGAGLQLFFQRFLTCEEIPTLKQLLADVEKQQSQCERTVAKAAKTILNFFEGDASENLASNPDRLCQFLSFILVHVHFSLTWIENLSDRHEGIALDFFLRVNQNGMVLSVEDTLKAKLLSHFEEAALREEAARMWEYYEARLSTYSVYPRGEKAQPLTAFEHLFPIAIRAAVGDVPATCNAESTLAEVRSTIKREFAGCKTGARAMFELIEAFGAAYVLVLDACADTAVAGILPREAKSHRLRKLFPGDAQPFSSVEARWRFAYTVHKLHWFGEAVHRRFWHPVAVALTASFLRMPAEARAEQEEHLFARLDDLVAWAFYYTLVHDWNTNSHRERMAKMLKAISPARRLGSASGASEKAKWPRDNLNLDSAAVRRAFDAAEYPEIRQGGKAQGTSGGGATPRKRKNDDATSATQLDLHELLRQFKYTTSNGKPYHPQLKLVLMMYELSVLEQSEPTWAARAQHIRRIDVMRRNGSLRLDLIMPCWSTNTAAALNSTWFQDATLHLLDDDGVATTTTTVVAHDDSWKDEKIRNVMYANTLANVGLCLKVRQERGGFNYRDRAFAFRCKFFLGADGSSGLRSLDELWEFAQASRVRVRGVESAESVMRMASVVKLPGQAGERAKEEFRFAIDEVNPERVKRKSRKQYWCWGGKTWNQASYFARQRAMLRGLLTMLFPRCNGSFDSNVADAMTGKQKGRAAKKPRKVAA